MQIPLQITVRDMAHSDALEDRIRERVAGLERFHPRMTSCRVVVAEARKYHQQGRQFEVRIDVRVPGHAEIVATRQHDEDVYVALRDAFDSVKRQLEEVVREKRGTLRPTDPQHRTVAYTRTRSAGRMGRVQEDRAWAPHDGKQRRSANAVAIRPQPPNAAPFRSRRLVRCHRDDCEGYHHFVLRMPSRNDR